MATAAKSYGEEGMDLFDHIDDLLDFPNDEDVMGPMAVDPAGCGGHGGIGGPDPYASLVPPLDEEEFLAAGVGDSGDVAGGVAGAGAGAGNGFGREEDKLVQCDDIDVAQLEWLSNFFDDTTDNFSLDFPDPIANANANANSDIHSNGFGDLVAGNSSSSNGKEDSLFRTPSPVSVLETNSLSAGGSGGGSIGSASSSSSSSSSSTFSSGGGSSARALAAPPEPIPVVPARARSKRPRPATFSPRPHVTIPFLPPTSHPEAFAESANPLPAKKKKEAANRTPPASAAAAGEGVSHAPAPPAVRKCMHCEIQKTPQWRAGPMGPKTLCNACGVRYKSGRLFPEYRPAASPTFCPTIHSNSHKKVVEMRIKASHEAPQESAAKDSCDLLEFIRRRD